MSAPRAWITGAGGLIGSYLTRTAAEHAPGWQVSGLTRRDLDLTDPAAIERRFTQERPSLVIHCAAMSKSPACQQDPGLARQVNVDATARLAELAADIPFVFFSTDLVFDGRQGHYVETDAVHPLSIYAETKAEAEVRVLPNPRHTVIRTSLNGGQSPTGDRGFNEEIRLAWHAGRALTFFEDEFRAPIHASVTARAIWELVARARPGLYHLCGSERLSRLQIGQLLAARCPELNPQFKAGSLRDYQGPPRAPDTSLNCAKVQALLSFRLPGLGEWLAAHPRQEF
jgi:dTDP-4-dehydrorhamnose reductase